MNAYLAGLGCISFGSAVAAHILYEAARQWPRIWSTMLGRHLVADAIRGGTLTGSQSHE